MDDSQFSLARPGVSILRPFDGFEAVYDQQNANIPIAFPGTLDKFAGKPGFSPNLLGGVTCPFGSKGVFWFPAITPFFTGEPGLGPFSYQYVIHWRIRNVDDFGQELKGYNLSAATRGAPDTFLDPDSPNRIVVPSATETVIYQQDEVSTNLSASGVGLGNLRQQNVAVPSDADPDSQATLGLPLLQPAVAAPFPTSFPTNGTVDNTAPKGFFSQGITDLSAIQKGAYSYFRPYWTIAKGNEFLITAIRVQIGVNASESAWRFKGGLENGFGPLDAEFSNVYGTNVSGDGVGTHPPLKGVGIYTFFGTNP